MTGISKMRKKTTIDKPNSFIAITNFSALVSKLLIQISKSPVCLGFP